MTQQQQQQLAVAIDREVSSRYDVGQLLGTGSYGSVFAAVDRITKQCYAVKVVSRSRLGQDGESKMEMEVNIMKNLDHPRILRMVNYIPSVKHYNIVMEKVDGGELFNHLLRVKRYTERKACRVIFNLLRALKHMHDRGMMHCDIKPENLLLVKAPTNDEEVTNIKLADFGLATYVNPSNYPTKACGSPLYIAPEVLECGLTKTRKFYTEAADLWSVGIITYLLVSGMIPFFGKTPNEIFKAVLQTNHNFKNKAWEPISDLAKDFINLLLVKDPEQRLSCSEALQHEWIQTVVAEEGEEGDRELPATLEGLKKFNAQQKLKGAMYGVEATFRMAYLSRCKKAKIKPNSRIVETLTNATEPIKKIDLSGNYLGPKGLQTLMAALTEDKSSHVQDIDISNTFLDDAQLLELVSLVYSNSQSQSRVKQEHSSTSSNPMNSLLPVSSTNNLHRSSSLLQPQDTTTTSGPSTPSTLPARGSLVLGDSQGRIEAPIHLANVRSINLSNNELTHTSGRILIDLVRMRPNLINIDVSGNHIKDSIVKRILAQCAVNLNRLQGKGSEDINSENRGGGGGKNNNNNKDDGSSSGSVKKGGLNANNNNELKGGGGGHSRRANSILAARNSNNNNSSILPALPSTNHILQPTSETPTATPNTTKNRTSSIVGGNLPPLLQKSSTASTTNMMEDSSNNGGNNTKRTVVVRPTTTLIDEQQEYSMNKANPSPRNDNTSASVVSNDQQPHHTRQHVKQLPPNLEGKSDIAKNQQQIDEDEEEASPVGGARGLLRRRKQLLHDSNPSSLPQRQSTI